MNKIKFFITLILLTISINLQAQKVKLKKGIVLIDDSEIMKYEKTRAGNDLSLYDFNETKIYLIELSLLGTKANL